MEGEQERSRKSSKEMLFWKKRRNRKGVVFLSSSILTEIVSNLF